MIYHRIVEMYKSQIGQDKWVHSVVGDKQNGFFIELGASDGDYLSNTYFFEKTLNWNGICIEPNPVFHKALRENRACHICTNCVSNRDDMEVAFASCGHASGVTSTAGPFTNSSHTIQVRTSTMKTILERYNAPKLINYLSLDVEGHEYEILQTFPFDDYTIECITVEHNEPHVGPDMRMKIRTILESKGYRFIKGNDDVCGWNHGPIDDFYVHSSIQNLKE
jgi:hypothetical protein